MDVKLIRAAARPLDGIGAQCRCGAQFPVSAKLPRKVTCPDGIRATASTSLRSRTRLPSGGISRSMITKTRVYDDLGLMLDGEAPDFVDIASPPAFHAKAIRAVLDGGCACAVREAAVPRPRGIR